MGKSLKERAKASAGSLKKTLNKAKDKTQKTKQRVKKTRRKIKKAARKTTTSYGDSLLIREYKLAQANKLFE